METPELWQKLDPHNIAWNYIPELNMVVATLRRTPCTESPELRPSFAWHGSLVIASKAINPVCLIHHLMSLYSRTAQLRFLLISTPTSHSLLLVFKTDYKIWMRFLPMIKTVPYILGLKRNTPWIHWLSLQPRIKVKWPQRGHIWSREFNSWQGFNTYQSWILLKWSLLQS